MCELRFANSVLLAASLVATAVSAQSVAVVRDLGGTVTVSVTDAPNALEHAIHEVSRSCRCVISYEGPEWSYAGDVRVEPDGRGRTVTSTRKGSLNVGVTGTLPLTREVATDIIHRLVAENERNGTSARFEVVQGRTIEVRAVRFRDRSGVERPPDLVLDTPITLAEDRLDASRWLQRIAGELSRMSGKRVSGVYPPGGPRFADLIPLQADGEPARQVLDRMLAQLPRPAGWSAMYVPSINSHSLALRFQTIHE